MDIRGFEVVLLLKNKISTYQHVKQLKAQAMILNVLKLLL